MTRRERRSGGKETLARILAAGATSGIAAFVARALAAHLDPHPPRRYHNHNHHSHHYNDYYEYDRYERGRRREEQQGRSRGDRRYEEPRGRSSWEYEGPRGASRGPYRSSSRRSKKSVHWADD